LSNVLRKLEGLYDHVVVDCPPVLGLSDAPLLGQAIEGVVFVVEPEGAPVRGIRSSLERMRMLGANIFIKACSIAPMNVCQKSWVCLIAMA
jgi:Mrp family chromosome partitioning ATPase